MKAPAGFPGLVAGVIAVSIVLLAAVAFPFVSRAYAANSIPELEDQIDGNSAKSGDTRSGIVGETALGYRSLPLLSDADLERFKADRAAAILELSNAVFDDALTVYAEIAANEDSAGMTDFQQAVTDGTLDLGLANDAAQRAFAGTTPDESDVLRLIGYLLVEDVDISIDSPVPNEVLLSAGPLALALSEAAAGAYGSCDAKLAYAHAWSLVRLSDPGPVDRLFEDAAAECGLDVTPTVARAYYDLGYASEGQVGCEVDAPNISPSTWRPILALFRDVQRTAPANPAGYIGEGDTYRIAAEVMSRWNVQPFTIRSFQRSAVAAYNEARRRSSSPEIVVSLARTHLALGDPQRSTDLLRDLPAHALEQPEVRELNVKVLAEGRKYGEAAALAGVAYDQERESLVEGSDASFQLVGQNAAFGVDDVTGLAQADSANVLSLSSCGGGSLAHDYGFTPVSRTMDSPFVTPAQLDYGILAGAWDKVPAICVDAPEPDNLPCEVLDAAGEASSLSGPANDYHQNLLRSADDLDGAAVAAEAWARFDPGSPTAHERVGEIRFLQEQWGASASASAIAAKLYAEGAESDGIYEDRTGPSWAQLREAVALREADQATESRALLKVLVEVLDAVDPSSYEYDPLLTSYAQQELGLTEYNLKHYEVAIDFLRSSIELGHKAESPKYGNPRKVLRGVQAQAASAAALKLERFEEAREFAEQALAIDPYSPLFRETLAEAERNVDGSAATAAYRSALKQDASLFSTWNNLGVIQYQEGHTSAAISSFEHAVAIKPGYAIGWFNLGVVESEGRGFRNFLRSQGALGKAASLDHGLKNRDPTAEFDEEIYDSGLDLSRPVPANWQLAETSRSRPEALGIGLLLMLLIRAGWALGSDWLVGRGVERAIEREVPRRAQLRKLLAARPSAVWTSSVSVIALVFLAGASGAREIGSCAAIFGALVGAHALAPRAVSRGQFVHRASFVPASILTAILAVPGLGFTPPAPLRNDDEVSAKVRRSGVVMLGCLTVLLGLIAWISAVPLARSTATACLVLLSSALVPVYPLDGARLALNRSVEIAITLALGAATVLFAAGIV